MTLAIRRVAQKDAAAITQMMSEPAVFGGLMQLPYPSEEAWSKRLAEVAAPGSAELVLVAELDGAVVGNGGLHPVSVHVRRRHVMGLGLSVAPAAQGKGVGTALMAALLDYADRWVGVQRVELTVYTDNAVAIRLYRRFGFEIEGTLRGYALRDGQCVDAYTMARLRAAPPLATGHPPTV